jgi:hypothetical protein
MKLLRNSLLVVFMSLFAFSAYATEWTPFQLSLVKPVQLFPEETRVDGLRINLLYGVNKEVNGLDYGVINRTTGTTQGVQLGAFPFAGVNITESLYGIQFGGILGGINIAGGDVEGLQISGIFGGINKSGNLKGIQIAGALGGINMAENVNGVQIAGSYLGINLAKNMSGVQVGTIYNQAQVMEGVQLGLVNVCNKMHGIQLGLVNIIMESNVPFFPVVNASF